MTNPQAAQALSEHAISHAIDMARGESHKQGDAAFHRAFARALWRQWTAQTAAPQPEAQTLPDSRVIADAQQVAAVPVSGVMPERLPLSVADLKDRISAVSAAIEDQDDRAAQAILRETILLLSGVIGLSSPAPAHHSEDALNMVRPAPAPLTPLLFSRRMEIARKLGTTMDAALNAIVRETERAHGIGLDGGV